MIPEPRIDLDLLFSLPLEDQVRILAQENERRADEIQRLLDVVEKLTFPTSI